MNINNIEIKVETQSINPMLNIWVHLDFEYLEEIPISISGKLCHKNGQIISVLTEYQLNVDRQYGLILKAKEKKNSIRNPASYHSVQLSALLTPSAIESIEIQREKNKDKSVEFHIELVYKTLTSLTDLDDLGKDDLVRVNITSKSSSIRIEQSDWINNFSPTLGIGNFLLLELNIGELNVTEFWKGMFEQLTTCVLDMEKSIQLGEWKKAIEYSRQIFDGLNLNRKKQGTVSFKDELTKILEIEQHNAEGINDLLNAIKSLFDFTSKYAHPTDRNGDIKPYPNAKKEDAYFVYTLSIGLLNLIGTKIQT